MNFKSLVISDLARLGPVSFRQFMRQYFLPKGGTFPYVFWFRVVQCARRRHVTKWTIGVIAYPIMRHYEFKYGIHINPNIEVGRGLQIVHGEGVHLNCKKIGNNLTVYHGVTFGILNDGIPEVGDNVVAYPHSVIVGGIKVRNGAVIGALSYVSKDVNDNEIVAGAPAKVIGHR